MTDRRGRNVYSCRCARAIPPNNWLIDNNIETDNTGVLFEYSVEIRASLEQSTDAEVASRRWPAVSDTVSDAWRKLAAVCQRSTS